jgi:hypothetical protein
MSVQLFTKSLFCALCIFALAGTTTAQTVIWEDDFSDEAAFYADWTSGGTNTGTEDWVWLDDPSAINFGAQPDYGSTTASNGYIMFNSDANGNNSHDVTITSPVIDCSGFDEVYVTAENQYAFFSAATISIAELGVSTNGTDFTYYQIHTDVEQNNLQAAVHPVNVNISEVAANESMVFIQFRWRGFFEYTWKIDDIQLVDQDPRPENDMQVNQFHAVAPNAAIPASQVGPFGFIADIQNVGSMAQASSTLTVTINDGTSDVFTDQLSYGNVEADSTDENVFFDNEFTPDNVPNTLYIGTYSLALEGVEDANPNNNNQTFEFIVSDTLFAKDSGTGLYGTQPADDNDYRFGCVYYVPNGDGLEARHISFLLGNADDLAGSTVTTFLYEWDGVGGEDFTVSEDDELGDPLAFNFYTIEGDENSLITIPVSFDDGFVPLSDDTYYIAVVEFAPNDEDTDNFMAVSSEIDYAAMNFYQDSVDNKDQYVVALDVSNTGEYSLVGFGFDVVPVVRLSITGTGVATESVLLPTEAINVYPTVADQEVWAEINLEEQAKVLNVTVVSSNGTLVHNRQLKNVSQEKMLFDVSQLAAGHYYIRLETEEGLRSKPFIIQR